MGVVRDFITGLLSVLKLVGAPLLYRYPYRTSAEGLRSDWGHIGRDIESVIGRLEAGREHG
ncbi:MAG: hypothetical protein KGJ06_05525 [Pseudomonadota bacterium]|nr:hypothetical protein [Pseudomonadota bacterium]